MEELLGFTEESRDNEELGISSLSSSSYSYKLVPWLSWDEWLFVEESLFSNSPDIVASALRRISTWRSRGCLPIVIEVTASIIEIQQKDPHFRKDQSNDALDNCRTAQSNDVSLSEEMLAMLYCMAIMRLVNGVVEKTRKKTEVSIAVAADAIGIPRTLIDIRHEGSHRELPTLVVVRTASLKALDWLKCYYWEPQKKKIPFHGNETAEIRNEIRSKFHELAFCLRVKETPQPHSSKVKKKCGSKKDLTRILKSLSGMYSSFSSEVVSVLLEFLLEAINSTDSSDLPVNTQTGPGLLISLNEWKLVITKILNKEPELLIALLNAVLDKIETLEAVIYETGRFHTSSDRGAEILQVDHLSSLFTWLVGNFEGLKPHQEKDSAVVIKVSSAEKTVSKAILMELLRKCLVVSASANNKLVDSAAHLAQLTGDSFLVGKLHKLSSFVSSNSDGTEEEAVRINLNNQFNEQEESISHAAEKLELIKRRIRKSKAVKTADAHVGNTNRWVLAKSWNPCPIGMLPRAVGSSGCLPVLDVNNVPEKVPELLGRKELWELNQCSVKRNSSEMQLLDNPCAKKMRVTSDGFASEGEDVLSPEDVDGHLMIGGAWKKVGEEELLAIKSAVRILI
ncbi:uncharacterized protein LOC103946347 isoform X1 [Pyrus x bretschneideri]|uniref:uncharacterized protein LOC103946347 isoform X1 n=1 Tax=Pyrus x bretschneideri TaxID=225117 RepID=UPI0020305122|nr:uncharacterized protein LOC103946347 isoform X1 [Pyrus x bretschneideri]XP_048437637.1 uncharacterized protein LOC103946347 isoform X1 [Pyrus x bretschneideri]XP_048437638.1 uncharacterized protein LOC103946347 isoform X1 [Pyrus x bretschneideri]XP_048437639.1 uncharacterized protein LOC103946347 isoform X1 [Pyrus x bretschneideri]